MSQTEIVSDVSCYKHAIITELEEDYQLLKSSYNTQQTIIVKFINETQTHITEVEADYENLKNVSNNDSLKLLMTELETISCKSSDLNNVVYKELEKLWHNLRRLRKIQFVMGGLSKRNPTINDSVAYKGILKLLEDLIENHKTIIKYTYDLINQSINDIL